MLKDILIWLKRELARFESNPPHTPFLRGYHQALKDINAIIEDNT